MKAAPHKKSVAGRLSWIFGVPATLWILYTLFQITRYGMAVVLDPATTSRIMGVRNDGVITPAIGLTYHGLAGAVLVLTQIVVVTLALVAALRASGRRRLLGLLLLVAWSALWLGNALWLRSVGWQHGTFTVGMAVALGVTIGWTVCVALEESAG